MDDQGPTRLRRDAERNRQRVLTAARRLFSETGLAVSHDEVARAAGVGVGTVYRRFPRKEDLLLALFEDQVEQVVQLAETAGARADPWRGLTTFLEAMLQMQAEDRGLHEYLLGPQAASLAVRATERISPVVGDLLSRAKELGQVRADVEVADVALVPVLVGAVLDRARGVAPDQWRRVLALVMDGFRPGADGSLPGQPLDPGQLEQVFTHWKGRPA
ncbi:helix-turn-helix domain containing protein [Modestobacter sp. VKM Ac-2986]|uniref:TetR/AcrR family transcriptional regulator n=1 Tax=Modestobacter sp. VKM Ac-2986 TaxID=3004140 RepID=UPI0022AA5369|nr:TetR/AcrR family transcriptional regulator [Modestobacter sp. VKM Ac-2986]MCZ2827558.1 helix-turn-helix domain containing protein [Modestobacter sp. VKM Ac-2986]